MRHPALPAQAAPPAPQANTATARQMYEAARAYRSELSDQLDRLEERRESLLESAKGASGPDRAGLESQVADLNARITALDKTLAQADQQVATAAALPGAVPRESSGDNGPPEGVVFIVFLTLVIFPLAVAAAWRIVRGAPRKGQALPAPQLEQLQAQQAQLAQLTASMGAIAEEIERIGEGQRFLTRVMSDPSRSLVAGGAQPLPAAAPEGVPAYRASSQP